MRFVWQTAAHPDQEQPKAEFPDKPPAQNLPKSEAVTSAVKADSAEKTPETSPKNADILHAHPELQAFSKELRHLENNTGGQLDLLKMTTELSAKIENATSPEERDYFIYQLRNANKSPDFDGYKKHAMMVCQFLKPVPGKPNVYRFEPGNDKVNDYIGMGDLLRPEIRSVKFGDRIAYRNIAPDRQGRMRIGYRFDNGEYAPIYRGDELEIDKVLPTSDPEVQKSIEEERKLLEEQGKKPEVRAVAENSATSGNAGRTVESSSRVEVAGYTAKIDQNVGRAEKSDPRSFLLEMIGRSPTEVKDFITDRDPETGEKLRFMNRDIQGGVNMMIIPYLHEATSMMAKAGITFSPKDLLGYSWRNIKKPGGGSGGVISYHGFGMALDADSKKNPQGTAYEDLPEGKMPMPVVEIMESLGFHWLGRARPPDAMHFEYQGNPLTNYGKLKDLKSKECAEYVLKQPQVQKAKQRADAWQEKQAAIKAQKPRSAPKYFQKPSANREKQLTYDQARQKLLDENPGFLERLTEISDKIGCSNAALLKIIGMECRFNPQAVNPQTGASGLIQFMPKTARDLGTTVEKIRGMGAMEQLDLVEAYFRRSFGKIHTYAELYLAVFYPLARSKGNDFVLGSQVSPAKVAQIRNQNSGMDKDHKGYITKADFLKYAGREPDPIPLPEKSEQSFRPNEGVA